MKKFGSELSTRGFAVARRTAGIFRLGIAPQPNPQVAWLESYLSDGPVKAAEVLGEAERLGQPKELVFKAKDTLKVESFEIEGRKIWQTTTPF